MLTYLTLYLCKPEDAVNELMKKASKEAYGKDISVSEKLIQYGIVSNLSKCKNIYKVILNFLNFHLANSHLKYSSTYGLCQLNLFRVEIRQKKSTSRSLQKESSSLKMSLQNELNLIDFAHVITLFEIKKFSSAENVL